MAKVPSPATVDRAFDKLVDELTSKDRDQRISARYAILDLGAFAAYGLLVRALRRTDSEARRTAIVIVLATLGLNPSLCPLVLNVLGSLHETDHSDSVRRAAIFGLSVMFRPPPPGEYDLETVFTDMVVPGLLLSDPETARPSSPRGAGYQPSGARTTGAAKTSFPSW